MTRTVPPLSIRPSALACAALLGFACGGDDGDSSQADAAVTPDGGGAADGSGADASTAAVPTSAGPMFAYLQAGTYTSFAKESAVHPSAGPHGGGGVLTYLNPALMQSLTASNTEHPVGAAAIKEFYAQDGTTLTGWAAMVKATAGTDGDSWYWYEVFSTTDGSSPIEGIGNSICTGCHSAGADYVRVPFPLQ